MGDWFQTHVTSRAEVVGSGLQVLLGALTTGLSAATSGKQVRFHLIRYELLELNALLLPDLDRHINHR